MSSRRDYDVDVNSGGRDVTDAGELGAEPSEETQPGWSALELERRAAADRQIEAVEGRPAEDVRALAAWCELPPAGWWCSRHRGHEGPCAAREVPTRDTPAPVESALDMMREVTADAESAQSRFRDDNRERKLYGATLGEGLELTDKPEPMADVATPTRNELTGIVSSVHFQGQQFEPRTPLTLQQLIEYVQTTTLEERTRIRLELERMYPRQPGVIEQGYRGHMVQGLPTPREVEALAFCFRVALEHDHGGAKRVRRLLFAWFNADELGGFDFSDLWFLDDECRGHALAVINMIARSPQGWYPEHYGYAADMLAIVETYHPGEAAWLSDGAGRR